MPAHMKMFMFSVQTLREVERQHTREKLGQDGKGTDIHYLKNVILKLYETGTACTL